MLPTATSSAISLGVEFVDTYGFFLILIGAAFLFAAFLRAMQLVGFGVIEWLGKHKY